MPDMPANTDSLASAGASVRSEGEPSGAAESREPAPDDEPDITVGGEPWTEEQLAGMRAIAAAADLRNARRLLEANGYRVESPSPVEPTPDEPDCTSCDDTGIRTFNEAYCACSRGAAAKASEEEVEVVEPEGEQAQPKHTCDFCGCHENLHAATAWRATADRFRRNCNELRERAEKAEAQLATRSGPNKKPA